MGASRSVTRVGLGVLRQLSGVLAGGLAVLAVVLVVAAVVAARTGSPGPGTAALVTHGVGAVLGVGGQLYADRVRGRRGAVVAGAVAVLVVGVLAVEWVL